MGLKVIGGTWELRDEIIVVIVEVPGVLGAGGEEEVEAMVMEGALLGGTRVWCSVVVVGGTKVLLEGTRVLLGGTGVLVREMGILAGASWVPVRGTVVLVEGTGVLVEGTGVLVGGRGLVEAMVAKETLMGDKGRSISSGLGTEVSLSPSLEQTCVKWMTGVPL